MAEDAKILMAQTLELPPSEHAFVAGQIPMSPDRPDPELDTVSSATSFGVN